MDGPGRERKGKGRRWLDGGATTCEDWGKKKED